MTLHPIPPEFPYSIYEENLVFFFSVHKRNNRGGEKRVTSSLLSDQKPAVERGVGGKSNTSHPIS